MPLNGIGVNVWLVFEKWLNNESITSQIFFKGVLTIRNVQYWENVIKIVWRKSKAILWRNEDFRHSLQIFPLFTARNWFAQKIQFLWLFQEPIAIHLGKSIVNKCNSMWCFQWIKHTSHRIRHVNLTFNNTIFYYWLRINHEHGRRLWLSDTEIMKLFSPLFR